MPIVSQKNETVKTFEKKRIRHLIVSQVLVLGLPVSSALYEFTQDWVPKNKRFILSTIINTRNIFEVSCNVLLS